MIEFVLAVIFVLWLLGIIQVEFLNTVLFNFNGRAIDIQDILLFLLILWLVGLLPRPFREIVAVLFILWILSLLGIIAIAGLTEIIIFAVVVGAVIYLIKR
ncbi:MAG: hypothetical protein ACOCXQ_05010 [Patescibacteria group bacterium]